MNTVITITAVLLVLDVIYFTLIGNYFSELIETIQGCALRVKLDAVILCYIFLVFAIYHFLVKEKKTVVDAFILGFVIYGIYDLTNMATIAKWPWQLVIVDTIWGGILFATTYYITKTIHSF